MKKVWAAVLLVVLCAGLAGCADIQPPEDSLPAEDLASYYERAEYTLNGIDVSLAEDPTVEILVKTIDEENRTASFQCKVHAESEDGTFSLLDYWELTYTYDEKSEDWEMTDKNRLETSCELLSDLPEELCLQLLQENTDTDFTFEGVTTDRASKTAIAVYSYESGTAGFGEFGSITMRASMDASFSWSEDGGWKYTGCTMNDGTTYTGALSLYVGSDGKGMLNTDQFTIGFDLVVIDHLVCIENLRYQGSVCTLGQLHMGNARITMDDDGSSATILFDFVRDISNIEEDKNYMDADEYREFYRPVSGTGSVRLTADGNGGCTAELSLPGFITWKDNTLFDFVKSDIPAEPARGAEKEVVVVQPDPQPQPQPDPQPQPQPDPEPEPEPEPEPSASYVGTWICQAPADSGVTGTVTAVLNADGTCSFVCDLDITSLSRDTKYVVLDDVSKLPTDLLWKLMLGGTPTISVVYDDETDRLYTCLEKGMYVYFSREGSGGTGGFYDPNA